MVAFRPAVGLVNLWGGEPEFTGDAYRPVAAAAVAAAYLFELISPPGVLLGERVGVQRPPVPTAGVPMDQGIWLIRTGNRPQDSYRLPAAQVRASRLPADVLVVQRRNGARLYGYLAGMR